MVTPELCRKDWPLAASMADVRPNRARSAVAPNATNTRGFTRPISHLQPHIAGVDFALFVQPAFAARLPLQVLNGIGY